MAFTREIAIRLFDTDAAGHLFFAAQFRIAHEVFEDFMAHLGFPVGALLRARGTLYPVVHAEADYAAALSAGDQVSVRVAVARIGDRSFAIDYLLLRADGTVAGSVKLVHAAVDAVTRSPVPVPAPLRAALEPFREG